MEGSLTRLGNTSSSRMRVVKFANPTIKCLNNNRTRNLLLLWFTILANLPTEIKYSTSVQQFRHLVLTTNGTRLINRQLEPYLLVDFSTLIPHQGFNPNLSSSRFSISYIWPLTFHLVGTFRWWVDNLHHPTGIRSHTYQHYLVYVVSSIPKSGYGSIQVIWVFLSFQRTFLCQEYYSLSYYKDNSNIWIIQIKIMKMNGFP